MQYRINCAIEAAILYSKIKFGFINRFCRNWFLATLCEEGKPEKVIIFTYKICICADKHQMGDSWHMLTYNMYMYKVMHSVLLENFRKMIAWSLILKLLHIHEMQGLLLLCVCSHILHVFGLLNCVSQARVRTLGFIFRHHIFPVWNFFYFFLIYE